MTLTLHLGVVDIPYAYDQQQVGKNGKPLKRAKKVTLSTTTGDVAEILEAKYHLIEVFYEEHEDDIAKAFEESLAATFENVLLGVPPPNDPFAAANNKIEAMFKTFLSSQEVERIGIPGTPTKAALAGVSHRFAHPYAKRAPRPSFIDTGLYEASFSAWMDEEG